MQAREHTARAKRDASLYREKERNIIVVRASVGARCPIRAPFGLPLRFADLISESERPADVRSKVHARIEISTYSEKRVDNKRSRFAFSLLYREMYMYYFMGTARSNA